MAKAQKKLTQAERSAESDRYMFESAIRLIVERGPEKTTLTDIGIDAGYSRGLATYRYKTKDVFFTAVIEHLHQAWCRELDQAIENTQGRDSVLGAVTALQNFVKKQPDMLRAMYNLYYYSVDHQSEMTQKLDAIHTNQRRQAMSWAQQAIERGEANPQLPLERFAEQYCALIFGAIYQWLVNPKKVDLKRLLESCKTSLSLIMAGSW
jgi:AcrR family transcriptional regulator